MANPIYSTMKECFMISRDEFLNIEMKLGLFQKPTNPIVLDFLKVCEFARHTILQNEYLTAENKKIQEILNKIVKDNEEKGCDCGRPHQEYCRG